MRTSFDEGARPVFDVLPSSACFAASNASELQQVLSGEIGKPSCAAAAMPLDTKPRPSLGEQLRTYSKLSASWQQRAAGSIEAAAVLVELDAEYVAYGGPHGIKEQGKNLIR